MATTPRLKEKYLSEVAKAMMEKFGYKNVMEIPRVEKVVLNMGVGEAVANPKVMDSAINDMTLIAGQRPIVTRAKKAIATFKIRQNMPIGLKVTLRGTRMFYFLDKLMNVALPRVRDFRGLNAKSFDGRGNYSMGVKEQIIFPEIDYDKIDALRGLDITLTTTARNDDEGRALLRAFNFPFRN